jgi:hypothetical protein
MGGRSKMKKLVYGVVDDNLVILPEDVATGIKATHPAPPIGGCSGSWDWSRIWELGD